MSDKRVLVIDDEDDLREIARDSLELLGDFQVSTSSSGIEGLADAKAQHPDAILLDMMMPGMDGSATFQKLQDDATTQGIPVILLTAKVQSSDRLRFAEMGVAGVIAKPFDPISLASQVAQILDWSQ
jgi:two-component system alkaline phosphatase synthesis response regulator PhoP